MKKTLVLAILVALCASLCISCQQEPSHKLSGMYRQSYPDTEGTGPFYFVEFSGQRVFKYDKSLALLQKGDYSLEGTSLSILWDSGKRSSYTVTFPYKGDGVVTINGFEYFLYR